MSLSKLKFQEELAEQDYRVAAFLRDNTELLFIDKNAFDECYYKIKAWIDIQVLVPFLKRYRLLTEDDEHYLTNHFTSRVEKAIRLVQVADKGGRNGYMLLYMCFIESVSETRGHGDVVSELDDAAKRRKELKRTLSESSAGSSQGPEDKSDPIVENEISNLQDQFSNIAATLLLELDNNQCRVETVRSRISVLPDHLNKEIFLTLSVQELSGHCDSIHTLFNFLNAKVWNFVDYHLLKFLVDMFSSDNLKASMVSYVHQLELFLMNTPVRDFIVCWDGHNTKPSSVYTEFEVKFNPDSSNDFTLEILNQFRKKIQTKFLPPLSEYALIHYKHRLGCFIITWILPMDLALKIRQGVLELRSFEMFERYFIEYVSIHNEVVYKANDCTASTAVILDRLKHDYPSIHSIDRNLTKQDSASKLSLFEDNYLAYHTPLPERADARGCLNSTVGSGTEDDDDEYFVDVGVIEDKITLPKQLASHAFIQVKFNSRQDMIKKHDNGCFPSISINHDGVVVEVCHKSSTYWMLYRVGKLRNNIIDWNASRSLSKPSKAFYGTGSYPQISLNDSNMLVEVHGGAFKEKCYYRIGKVVPLEGIITWSPSRSFEKIMGHYPNIAINNSDFVVVVYQRDILTKTLCYRVGKVSAMKTGEIAWVGKDNTLRKKAENFAIGMNNENMVVLTYQTYKRQIHYLVGRLNFVKGEILWGDPVRMFAGRFPNVSVNDNNHVILTHQRVMSQHLFSYVGKLIWERNVGMISWSKKREKKENRYGKGHYPSVSMNKKGEVVEAHMAEFPNKSNLHYYTGQIVLES